MPDTFSTQQIRRLGLPLLIFLAALLPRLYQLGSFLTIDELKWAEGAAQFMLGLQNGDLAQTYWHFFPGVTTTWGAAKVLWWLCWSASDLTACTTEAVANLPATIGWLRLSPVLMTAAGISGVYLLLRRLLNQPIALLTALLLAFDPFFVAHSRILNGDAIAAVLMFLSLLTFWQSQLSGPAGNKTLLLSGALAGLALLTKLPAPIIGAFIGGLSFVMMMTTLRRQRGAAVKRWVVALAGWGLMAGLVFVALWPAMWVAPLETLRLMYIDSFEVGGVGAGHDTYFMGQISADPGVWFYPYAIALRLTPVVSAGLLVIAGWGLLPVVYLALRLAHYLTDHLPGRPLELFSRGSLRLARFLLNIARQVTFDSPQTKIALVMAAYIISIILFANISPKKLDRYVMAVIPPLLLLAAMGLNLVYATLKRRFASRLTAALLPLLIGLQLVFAVTAAPYYLTYYNPLLGGIRQAAATAPVGWGEGLERAAAYLNSLPNPNSLRVSSWYSDIFNPYFEGQRASFADDGRAQLSADYVVFYINQIQRQKPYPGLINYFEKQEPAFVFDAGAGPDWPWVVVYPAPAAQSAGGTPKIEGIAQLLAYKITGAGQGDELSSPVEVTLFLRVLGPLPDETTLSVALFNGHTRRGEWQPIPVQGEWQPGHVIEWRGRLAEIPPGEYRLWAAYQFKTGPVIAVFEISDKDPPVIVE